MSYIFESCVPTGIARSLLLVVLVLACSCSKEPIVMDFHFVTQPKGIGSSSMETRLSVSLLHSKQHWNSICNAQKRAGVGGLRLNLDRARSRYVDVTLIKLSRKKKLICAIKLFCPWADSPPSYTHAQSGGRYPSGY